MQLQALSQLADHWDWGTALSGFWFVDSPIPDRAGNEHLAITVIFPEQALNLTVPQPHEGGHCESGRGGLRKVPENRLYLIQRIGIRFSWLYSARIDPRITGGVLSAEIIKLLCQGENPADCHVLLSVVLDVSRG